MTEPQYWDLSERVTNPEFGCSPEERSLQDLLNSGVILVEKPRGPTSHQLTAWARDLLGIGSQTFGSPRMCKFHFLKISIDLFSVWVDQV